MAVNIAPKGLLISFLILLSHLVYSADLHNWRYAANSLRALLHFRVVQFRKLNHLLSNQTVISAFYLREALCNWKSPWHSLALYPCPFNWLAENVQLLMTLNANYPRQYSSEEMRNSLFCQRPLLQCWLQKGSCKKKWKLANPTLKAPSTKRRVLGIVWLSEK